MRIARVLALIATIAVLIALQARPSGAAGGSVPASFPSTFSFGVRSQIEDVDWIANSGVPFDFRYLYINGGVNTGKGWQGWANGGGSYVGQYIEQSTSKGFRPVFVYYQLLESKPGIDAGDDEESRVIRNLDNAGTMYAYFDDWARLMKLINASGKTAYVIVEPDLWGYLQRAANDKKGGNDARLVPAAVTRSGFPDVQGIPDTAQGFAWSLLNIKKNYAPDRAILLPGLSPWSTGVDAATDTFAGRDASKVAKDTSDFLRTIGFADQRPNGVPPWDLMALDVANQNAGYAQARCGCSWLWWDRQEIIKPHLGFFLDYVKALSDGIGQRVLLWQVPVGNQVYRSVNNTSGAYQDNKAELFFGNLPRLADAGIIGILFGPAFGDDTHPNDQKRDGVSNPSPINGNTKSATVADDDGGYLRDAARQYYQNRLALPGTGTPPTAQPATPTSTAQPATPTSVPVASKNILIANVFLTRK